MKKKKILYSEMKPVSPEAAAPAEPQTVPPAAAAPAPRGAMKAAEKPTAPAAKAPLDLARALAAARTKELAAEAPAAPSIAPAGTSGVPTAEPDAVPVSAETPRPVLRLGRLTTSISTGVSLRDRARTRMGKADVLVFRVGTERFAVDLGAVEEAIDLPAVQYVPEMPPAMVGVATVRGGLTAVYTPHAALGLPRTKPSSALIFRRGRWRLAIVVNDVDDVTTIDLAELRDSHELDAGEGLVLGIARHEGALLALLDADALLAACQAVPILETA